MTRSLFKGVRGNVVCEIVLMGTMLVSLASVLSFLRSAGYLPAPFFYAVDDTLMDWYNTAYWSNNYGEYSIWRSIYPPISFDFLRLFSLHSCYQSDPAQARGCDWLGRAALLSFYTLNVGLVYRCFRNADRQAAVPRTVTMCLGLPMLFTMDRGNLIVPCFTFFILGHGRILRSARLALDCPCHFDQLQALSFRYASSLRFSSGGGGGLRVVSWPSLCVYLISFVLNGTGTPGEVWANITAYTEKTTASYIDNAFYGASYVDIKGLVSSDFPLMNWIGSRSMEAISTIIPLLIRFGQLGVALCFLAVPFRPAAVPTYRLAAMSMTLVLSSVEVGGYAQVFLIFLVFLERWTSVGSVIAIICAYLLKHTV